MATTAEKREILEYIIKTTLGDELKSIKDDEMYEELEADDINHLHLKVVSRLSGEYHIRIRRFKREDHFYLKGTKDEYDKVSLYYQYVNHHYTQKVPSFYHYK
jgi:hypothetical protein